MPLTIKQESNFTPAPSGHHVGIVIKVIDLGHQEQTWEGKVSYPHQCFIEWELPEHPLPATDEYPDPKPMTVARFLTISTDKKSNMLPLLEGWKGRALQPMEKVGFDLFNILGHSCYVSVIHDEKGKAKVNSLSPPDEKSKSFEAKHPLMSFSFEDGGEIPEDLYGGVKDIIMRSREYNEGPGQQNDYDYEPPQEPAIHGDEDIPF